MGVRQLTNKHQKYVTNVVSAVKKVEFIWEKRGMRGPLEIEQTGGLLWAGDI